MCRSLLPKTLRHFFLFITVYAVMTIASYSFALPAPSTLPVAKRNTQNGFVPILQQLLQAEKFFNELRHLQFGRRYTSIKVMFSQIRARKAYFMRAINAYRRIATSNQGTWKLLALARMASCYRLLANFVGKARFTSKKEFYVYMINQAISWHTKHPQLFRPYMFTKVYQDDIYNKVKRKYLLTLKKRACKYESYSKKVYNYLLQCAKKLRIQNEWTREAQQAFLSKKSQFCPSQK